MKWNVQDYKGKFRTLELPALYVPTCAVQLISCSSLLQKYRDESIVMSDSSLVLTGVEGEQNRGSIVVWFNPTNNLPTSPAFLLSAHDQVAVALSSAINVVNTANINLSPSEKFYLE